MTLPVYEQKLANKKIRLNTIGLLFSRFYNKPLNIVKLNDKLNKNYQIQSKKNVSYDWLLGTWTEIIGS